MTTPSKFAERLIAIVVRDPEWRDGVIGDLREEHARLAARVGVARARRWHVQQSLGIALRYGTHRLLRRGTPPPRWLASAEQESEGSWTAGFTRDVLHAWRSVAQRPAVSAVIAITLALALSANSVTFSLLDAIALRPYRFPTVDRLLIVVSHPANEPQRLLDRDSVARGDYRDWQRESKTVQQWAAYEWWDANLSGVDVPEQVPGFRVTPGFFATLGITPILGREFLAEEAEPGRHRRVVLSHALWTRRFAAHPGMVGSSIRLDGEPYEVVGVAPKGFQVPLGAEAWAPVAYPAEQWQDHGLTADLSVIGRLAAGATLEGARAEIATLVERQRRSYPDTNANRAATVVSFTAGMADPGAGPLLGVWQGAAALLLLIACANIASLLMARGSERSQEYAVRLALGASRFRLFGQTLMEGLILSTLACAASVPLTAAGLGLSRRSIPESVIRFIPGFEFIQIDLRLLALTALLGTAATVIFSMVPALQSTRSDVSESLRQSGRTQTPARSRRRLRSVLATSQVALALALLFGSGLVLTAADRFTNGVLGFDKHNVLVAQLVLPERAYADAQQRRQFITRVIGGVSQIPAVTESGITSHIPYGPANQSRRFWPEGQALDADEARPVNFRRSSAGYFGVMRIPLIAGRRFDDGDRAESLPVAMVSTSLAQEYWPGHDPIGRRFKTAPDGEWVTVVGVTGDVTHNWFTERRDHTVYRPFTQDAPFAVAFTLKTVGDPTALAGDLRRAVAAADPDQPIASLTTLEELVEDRVGGFSFIANALGVVAMIALVLSVMGIYSLMSYLTSQRTQEIGVRMALGAGRWQVVRLTTAPAVKITVAGTLVGAALSIGLGRLMQSVMFGLVAISLLQLMALVSVLATAALLAAYLPARRAARLDPTIALRGD